MTLTEEQKAHQRIHFEQLLKAGVDPVHVVSLVKGYIDSLSTLLAGPLIPDNAELTRAYIQSGEEYLKALKTKFMLD